MSQSETGYRYLHFRQEQGAGKEDVPAFGRKQWKANLVATLPQPERAFGLFLWQSDIDDAGMKELARLKQLHTLEIGNTKVTDKGLKELAGLPQLQRLSLHALFSVSDAGLRELDGLKQLRVLNVGNAYGVTDRGLKELAAFEQLQTLDLTNTKVTDAGLKELAGLQQLQLLTLNGTRVTDVGLRELASLKQLQVLNLGGVNVTDAGLKEIATIKELQELFLFRTRVTDAGLKELHRLKQLRTLTLAGTKVTDAGLKELAGLKQLRWLNLQGTEVTDGGLRQLHEDLPQLAIYPRPQEANTARRPARPQHPQAAGDRPARPICRLGSARFRHGREMGGLAFVDDGKLLASWGGVNYAEIKLWEPASGKEVRRYTLQAGSFPKLAFSQDGNRFVIYGEMMMQTPLTVYDSQTGKEIRKLGAVPLATCCAFSPDGKRVAAGREPVYFGGSQKGYKSAPNQGRDPIVQIWEAETGQSLASPTPNREAVSAIGFSTDGQILAFAQRGDVRLWQIDQAKELDRIHTGLPGAASLFFTPDGKKLIIGAGWPTVRRGPGEPPWEPPPDCSAFEIWDVDTGKRLPAFSGQPRGMGRVMLSADGKKLACHGKQSIDIWAIDSGKKIRELADRTGFGSAMFVFAPDGRAIAGGSIEGTIRLWDSDSGKELGTGGGHQSAIDAMAFASDGNVATASWESIIVWSVPGGKVLHSFRNDSPTPVSTIAFSSDARELTRVDTECLVFRVSDGSSLRRFSCGTASAYWKGQNALSPDGKYLAHIAVKSEGPSGLMDDPLVVEIRDMLTGALVRKMEIANGDDTNKRPATSFSRALLSSDGKRLVVVTWRGGSPTQVDFYLGDTARGILTPGGGTFSATPQLPACALSPDGMTLAVGLRKAQRVRRQRGPYGSPIGSAIELWDTGTGKSVGELESDIASYESTLPTALAFSRDGTTLACGHGDGRISLWDVKTKRPRGQLAGHDGPVTCFAFDSHGRLLISGGADTTALVWDLDKIKR
jgi:WD40 repeat protein